MDAPSITYVSLEALAARLGLPKRYLRALASDGLIPSLDVNGRKRFHPDQVQESLLRLANSGPLSAQGGDQ